MPISIKDGAATDKFLAANGDGTSLDPYQPIHALPVGAATQATLAAVLAALSGAPLPAGAATQVTLAAVLAALSSVPVTAAALPLPVGAATQATQAGILAALASVAITAAALPLPAGAATQATLAGVLAALSSVPVTGPLTDAQLRAVALSVTAAALPLPVGAATQATLAGGVGLRPDLDGGVQSGLWTLSATPGTVTSVALPDAARIVTLKASADAQLALNIDPAALGAGAFANGAPLSSGERRAFLLIAGAGRTLRLRSATASATVVVEWRP